jgi:hypothetical protein
MKMEKFILDVLQGHLSVDGNEVRLIQSPPNYNAIPCLTIDNSAGARTLDSNKYNIRVDNRMQEAITTLYEIDLRLDIWALTEETRQSLINQVQTCFYQALSDHYQYCTRYNNGECETLDDHCLATLRDYATDKRAIKHQCPCPHELEYENLWSKYHIDITTFTLNPAYDLDELNETEPVLRSRFDISFNYKDCYIIGGKTSQDLINKEDTVNG